MYSSRFKENSQQLISRSEQGLKFWQTGTAQVEDDRARTDLETLKRAFTDSLLYCRPHGHVFL